MGSCSSDGKGLPDGDVSLRFVRRANMSGRGNSKITHGIGLRTPLPNALCRRRGLCASVPDDVCRAPGHSFDSAVECSFAATEQQLGRRVPPELLCSAKRRGVVFVRCGSRASDCSTPPKVIELQRLRHKAAHGNLRKAGNKWKGRCRILDCVARSSGCLHAEKSTREAQAYPPA